MGDQCRRFAKIGRDFSKLSVAGGSLALVLLGGCGQAAGAGGADAAAVSDVVQPTGDVDKADAAPIDAVTDTAVPDVAPAEVVDDAVTDVLDATGLDLIDAVSDGTDLQDAATDVVTDVAADSATDAVDVAPDVPATACELPSGATAGAAGATCVSDGDCTSGVCASAPEGMRCAPACANNCCATGWSCDKSGVAPICRPKWTALCTPCITDDECDALTSGSLCIKHGSEGFFCATPCAKTADCPTDYKCSFSYGVNTEALVCVTPGACDCNAAAIAAGAKTTCSNSNSAGLCKGQRVCTATGLQLCDALIPAPETCNGIDDDCNGKTDEGMPDLDGDGIPDCDDPDIDGDGVPNALDCAPYDAQVFPGNSEKCNGADDNCNGKTDEGFPDLDGDGIADCVDADMDGDGVPNLQDCSPTDGSVFQSNTEKCNGKDDNCNGKTDEGFPDTDMDGIADCVDPDIDGDGVPNALDCSPTDATVFPGQTETCNGKDDNCDGKTDEGFPDTDKDGLADCVDPDIDGDGVPNALDCAPTNGAIYPGAQEVCNGVDDNCDGLTDPNCDQDSDGYCNAALPCDPTSVACPHGCGDCDDLHASVHPGAAEICDGLDNNCDGITDPGCDSDGDGFCVGTAAVSASCPNGGGDCNDSDPLTNPKGTEICDNKDQNCNGVTDEGCDADKDGYCTAVVPAGATFLACPSGGGDCNDTNKAINPAAIDTCNGVDDNCDGVTDPGCDLDGDGYCVGNVPFSPGCVNGGGDCDDSNASIHPGAAEICDDIDNNCINGVDDGCDVDGDGWCALGALISGTPKVCSHGLGDCNDKNKSVYPGAPDLCDGLDNGCNGKVDVNCDQDGDGWCDVNRVTIGAPYACLYGGGDCDDNNFAIHPQHPDDCDLLDNDCDGITDPGCDVDGDGYCAANRVLIIGSGACPNGGGDCDDLHASVHPGATEICDDLDNNCDKATDLGCDDDGDGWCDANMTTVGTPKICPHGGGDCNDLNTAVYPTHVEICDGFDNNCDGLTDTGCDDDGDGFCDINMVTIGAPAVCPNGGGDCNDLDATIKPGSVEVCDGKDNNCINGTDEGCNDDGDAYCDANMTTMGKPQICPSGGGDCDDTNPQINPGAKEICDDLDNNCINGTDEKCDKDGDKYCDGLMITIGFPKICPYGGGDCNDNDPTVTTSANGSCFEICDGKDNNNDGVTDEGCDKDKDGYCDAAMTTVGTPPVCPHGGGDCLDSATIAYSASVNPGMTENCATPNDDNCDGLTDSDGALGCTKYYYDIDGDGYGGASVCYCNSPNSKQGYGSAGVDNTKAQALAVIGSDTSGVAFDIECPTGYIAFGVTGQYDPSPVYMVAFTLLCRKLNADGTLGVTGDSPAVIASTGPTFGGSCPNGELLTTLWGDSNGADASHQSLSRLGGHCSTISRIANQYTGWDDMLPNSPLLFDGGGSSLAEHVCPVGSVVTGAFGHYSTWVGDFGYKCSPVSMSTTFQVFVSIGGDCNDYDASVSPKGTESCDNQDNNCNGVTDEGCDGDKDGYCTMTKTVIGTPTVCPKGGGDCDDANAAVHPGVVDICDGIDNDCNGTVDPGCDKDADGYCDASQVTVGKPSTCPGGGGDCNDSNATVHPGAAEACDDIDQNCDGKTDEGCDDDLDGYCDSAYTVVGTPKSCNKGKGDCVDTNAAINPGVTEICNNIDDNCNGKIDETCDDDGDGWCRLGATFVGTVTLCTKGKTDCNDSNANVYPGAPERCDGLDNSCSGKTDVGCDDDKDGYCDSSMPYDNPSSCVHGGGDCADAVGTTNGVNDANINPGAVDICGNGVDDDCSGPGTMTGASKAAGTALTTSNQYDAMHWLAFSFSPTMSGTLASVNGLKLLRWNSKAPSTTLRIYNGLPGAGGTSLGSASQSVTDQYSWGTYNFSYGGIAVTKGVTYYGVLFASDTNSGFLWTNNDGSGAWASSNSGSTWSSSGTYPFSAIVTVSGIDGPVCK